MGVILGVNPTDVFTSLNDANGVALGTIGQDQDSKLYKFIKYEAGAAAVSGVAGGSTPPADLSSFLKTSINAAATSSWSW